MNVDFQELRKRLAAAEARSIADLDPARVRALLEERARKYAARAETSQETERLALLPFRVAGECLAVPTSSVVAIVPAAELSPLPLAPAFVPGVLGFRGEPVLVVALHVLAGKPAQPGPDAGLVVVQRKAGRMALLADEVLPIREVAAFELRPPVASTWLGAEAVRGALADGTTVVEISGLSLASRRRT